MGKKVLTAQVPLALAPPDGEGVPPPEFVAPDEDGDEEEDVDGGGATVVVVAVTGGDVTGAVAVVVRGWVPELEGLDPQPATTSAASTTQAAARDN